MTAAPGTAGRLAALYDLPPRPLYGSAGAEVYDAIARHDPEEIADVLRLARGAPGPVLELACGSGRLTLPLVARGHDVVALDNSPALLGLLADRLPEERLSERRLPEGRRPRLVEGDMTSFALDESFGFVVLAASSVCLLDAGQRASTLRRVRDHLAPDGVFYVSVLDFAGAVTTAVRPVERVSVAVEGTSVITLFQHFDNRRAVRTTSLLHEQVGLGRGLFTSEVHLVGSDELCRELTAAGFEVVERRRGPDAEQVLVQLVCRGAV